MTYEAVRDAPDSLMLNVDALEGFDYYENRAEFNRRPTAALFLWLNRRGFNSLCRYNKRNEFNVPLGEPKFLYDRENLLACGMALENATMTSGDYATVLSQAGPGDFVYSDPPYAPISATSNFTGYTAGGFTDTQQREYLAVLTEARERGATIVASNSSASWLVEEYANAGWTPIPVEVQRSGGGIAKSKRKVTEFLFVSR